jgi:hypothetical protein
VLAVPIEVMSLLQEAGALLKERHQLGA